MKPRWISLCCGLAATECRAGTGRFPPVARMGGKRAYADGVLDILGTWPKRWLLIDADLAIVEFWQAAFAGLLPAVAEVIRNAPADGEELWRLWTSEPVPVDPVERVARWAVAQSGHHSGVPVLSDGHKFRRATGGRGMSGWRRQVSGESSAINIAARIERVARWIVCQKGNFSGKPLSYGIDASTWLGSPSFGTYDGKQYPSAIAKGFKPEHAVIKKDRVAATLTAWQGVAGFASLSPLAHKKGFRDRFTGENLARETDLPMPIGEALFLDLAASSPVVHPGDLVTIDPPYQGTSGYGAALSRARVVELAQEAHERGARVLVHEAEPVIEGGPWRALELHRTRSKGQRTWSKQKAEWVTINFEPATAHPGAAKDRAATRREMAPISGPLFAP